ncbi:MAG TPA: glycerophosphodiester phosphodiesterase [Candidatus Saccharimonadales bacterium]|nr:glycerophosphodiester phosphodiesterase [Candidatus Saccharimonadales bacterium]
MLIIGHRGAKGLAPENTIKAIKAGIAAGADWIEVDVRATQDRQVVLAHDATTTLAPNKKYVIAKTPSSEFAAAGKDRRIPTLQNAVKQMAGQTLNIELKSSGCEQAVRDAVEQLGYSRVVVSSFSRALLQQIYCLDPKIRIALLLAFNPFAFRKMSGLYAVGFHHLFAPRSAIALAKKQGLFTYAYTIDSSVRAQALVARGIDAIVTNYPNKFKNSAS